MPRELTDAHKRKCVEICQRLLNGYNDEDHRRSWSVTLSQNPKGTTEWKHLGSPTKKRFKTQPKAGSMMPTGFWECCLEEGSTVTRGGYSATLANQLKATISKNAEACFQRDCCCITVPAHSVETVLEHPASSPDLRLLERTKIRNKVVDL